MKLFFDSVCIDNHPVVWEESESTPNQLKCCFELVGSKPINKHVMLEKLSQIEGVIITDAGDAIIPDAETFYRSHPNIKNLPFSSLNSAIHSKIVFFNATLGDKRPIEKSHHSPRPTTTDDTIITPIPREELIIRGIMLDTPTPKTSADGTIKTPRSREEPIYGIMLDTLIPKTSANAGLWGDTVSHEFYFIDKTKEDAAERECKLLKSRSQLFLELQYQKNEVICPIRQELIVEIRYLFDKLLHVTFNKFHGHAPTLPELVRYFQDAIYDVMVLKPEDGLPTEYEKMSAEVRLEQFRSHRRFEYANKQMRQVRANVKLWPFLFFIDDDILSTDVTNNLKFSTFLDSLKFNFKEIQPEITGSISKLRSILIKLGIELCKWKFIEQKLDKEIADHKPSINEFISFHVLFKQFMEIEIRFESDSLLQKIITDAISMVYLKYMDKEIAKGQIVSPRNGDKDFYLSQNLADRLYLALTNCESRFLKNIHKDTHEETWDLVSQTVCDELNACIQKELLQENKFVSFHSLIKLCLEFTATMKIKKMDLAKIHNNIVTDALTLIKINTEDKLPKLSKLVIPLDNNKDFYLAGYLADNIILPLKIALPAHTCLKKMDKSKYRMPIVKDIYQILEPHFVDLLLAKESDKKIVEDTESSSSYSTFSM